MQIWRTYVHMCTNYEVSVTIHMGMRANERKIPKWLPFKNYKSESLNVYCVYMGDICAQVYQI